MIIKKDLVCGLVVLATALVSADAEIVENLIVDPGFEALTSGEPVAGGIPWSDSVPEADAHIQIRTGISHSGTNSVVFAHYARTGYLSQILGIQVESDTSYELSVWMMLDEASTNPSQTNLATINMALAASDSESGTYGWIGVGNKGTTPTVAGEWQKFTFEIDSSKLVDQVGRWLEVRFLKEIQPTEYRIFLDDITFGAQTQEPSTNSLVGILDDFDYGSSYLPDIPNWYDSSSAAGFYNGEGGENSPFDADTGEVGFQYAGGTNQYLYRSIGGYSGEHYVSYSLNIATWENVTSDRSGELLVRLFKNNVFTPDGEVDVASDADSVLVDGDVLPFVSLGADPIVNLTGVLNVSDASLSTGDRLFFEITYTNPDSRNFAMDDVSVQPMTVYSNDQPNILLIMVDDMGYSDLGCYGGEIRTPAIDALAENGVSFRNFYNGARCSPSRIALMSGLYPQQGAFDPSASLPTLRTDNNITLPELLGDHGFHTYMAGKWHIGFGAAQLPSARGFQHAYTSRYGDFWTSGDSWLDSENNGVAERAYGSDPYDFYATDVFADYSLDFLTHHAAQNDGESFFLYLAFTAPHFPLQVNSSVIETAPAGEQTYLEMYREGWGSIRQSRFNRMVSNGVVSAGTVLPGFGDTPYNAEGYWPVPDWDLLDTDRQEDLARRMALYAGMIEKMDAAVGRVTDFLDQTGQLDNTIIFILSDNGGNAEGGLYGRAYNTVNHAPLTGTQLSNMGQPGMSDGIYLGGGWANVANTPFRYYKRYTHGGGIRTPFIVHWPDGIQNPGRWTDQTGHLVDVTATIADVLELSCPDEYEGHSVLPWEGSSLLPAITNDVEIARQFGFEHESNRAWVDGDWKLVTKTFTTTDYSSFADTLELYDLSTDSNRNEQCSHAKSRSVVGNDC